jgi:hypothetical protein
MGIQRFKVVMTLGNQIDEEINTQSDTYILQNTTDITKSFL